MNFTIIILFFIVGSIAHFFVDNQGIQTLEAVKKQAVILPNVTEIADINRTVNVLDELKRLNSEIKQLQLQVTTLNETNQTNNITPIQGCNWEGVYCDCYLENTQDHAAILLGSYCKNSTLQWVKVIDMHISTGVLNCLGSVNASLCEGYFE